ncbi:hypothetical protein B0H13DRAFT_1917221 [Mycena leptocephala]|nr:hypothetical protein B0H13DRAFT_1917221 [Mycena leptocephala]
MEHPATTMDDFLLSWSRLYLPLSIFYPKVAPKEWLYVSRVSPLSEILILEQSNNNITFQEYQSYLRFLAENPGFNTVVPTTPTPTPIVPAQALAPPVTQQEAGEPPAPVSQPYQSARARIQPTPLIAPDSYRHFLGMGTLAPSASTLNTSHVNRERVRHANTVLPRSATSGLPTRCSRGPAQPSPVLARRHNTNTLNLSLCLVEGAKAPTVNVLVMIYPPLPSERDLQDHESGYQHHLIYCMLHADFIEKLGEYDLVYRYTLRLDSSVNDLLRRVVSDMASSPSAFTFPVARRASTAASTAITTVQLLGLVTQGMGYNTISRKDLYVYTKPAYKPSHTIDLG